MESSQQRTFKERLYNWSKKQTLWVTSYGHGDGIFWLDHILNGTGVLKKVSCRFNDFDISYSDIFFISGLFSEKEERVVDEFLDKLRPDCHLIWNRPYSQVRLQSFEPKIHKIFEGQLLYDDILEYILEHIQKEEVHAK